MSPLADLVAWLKKRGEPDSGINYQGPYYAHDEDGSPTIPRQARVELHGSDADFIAKHFHGAGARDLAAALLTAIEPVAASPGVPDGMARLQGSVPEGWKLVPVEPTEAMMNAAPASYSSSFMAIWPKICGDIYRALLAAAPASPEPSPSTEDVMREARGALAIALSAIEKAGDDLQASGAYP